MSHGWMVAAYMVAGALVLAQWARAVWGSGALARLLRMLAARQGMSSNVRLLLLCVPLIGAVAFVVGAMMFPGMPKTGVRIAAWLLVALVVATVTTFVWSLVE
ncbi:hypothetical protein FK268_24005, partial [Tsukamurella sputi]